MPLADLLRHAWRQRGPLARLLWPVSQLYAAAVRRQQRRWAAQPPARADVPVIVVGNVIAGGAGKTPVTLALLEHLRARGWRPGVVSRGYGRRTTDCREVRSDSLALDVGDEPLLIARRAQVPVFVARQRMQAVQALRQAHPRTNVIVCDDGLQHLALARDVEICVFNDEGAGNGWLLPAGPLREPWPRPVTAVLYAGACPPLHRGTPAFALRRHLAPEAVDGQGQRYPLAALRGQPLHAVAAVARPEEFFAQLRAGGLHVAQAQALPDHYDFESWSRLSGEPQRLVCTEKDAVKLWPRHPDALAVPLQLHIAPAFWQLLDARLASLSSPP